jgi:SRSO17 transposase
LKQRIGQVFRRAEVQVTAGIHVDGLSLAAARKTGWQLAEQAGLTKPYRVQSLLGRTTWDAEALRDKVRGGVGEPG